jgi:DNA-binding MarR family transcriptional regulator
MSNDLETFELLTDEATRLIARAESFHAPYFDFGTGVPLYRSEIHTIETIGKNPGINVTRLADKMGVTKGAVSQMLTRLKKKKLIDKRRMPGSDKEVMIDLSDLGRRAFKNHELFHRQILAVLKDHYGEGLAPAFERFRGLVGELSSILSVFEERMKQR